MPSHFKFKFKGLKIKGDWTKTLEQGIQVQIRQAAREWLRAVRDSIPEWTGQAKGSVVLATGEFGTFAEYLGEPKDLNPPHSKPSKNPETGGSQARYSFTWKGHRYSFNYYNTIDYFYYNSVLGKAGNSNPNFDNPWRAILKGRLAFEEYMRTEGIRKLPKIMNLLEAYNVGSSE